MRYLLIIIPKDIEKSKVELLAFQRFAENNCSPSSIVGREIRQSIARIQNTVQEWEHQNNPTLVTLHIQAEINETVVLSNISATMRIKDLIAKVEVILKSTFSPF
jgi:hypothetical protein